MFFGWSFFRFCGLILRGQLGGGSFAGRTASLAASKQCGKHYQKLLPLGQDLVEDMRGIKVVS